MARAPELSLTTARFSLMLLCHKNFQFLRKFDTPGGHNPTSIATLQVESSVAMAKRATRCPFCQKSNDLM
jgi:hypothetical protein